MGRGISSTAEEVGGVLTPFIPKKLAKIIIISNYCLKSAAIVSISIKDIYQTKI